MKKPSDNWDDIREQILGFGELSTRKSYYPALRKRIVELERSEIDLRESRERLELVLESSELGLWDWHVQADTVIYNERWKSMLGYTGDELSDTTRIWIELLHPDDAPGAQEVVDACLDGRTESFSQEFRMRHKDGHWVWILSRGKVTERAADGTPIRACGTHLDMTERKQADEQRRKLEAQVQHAQKLESLGVLAGGIAHDFNNLLVAILGNADLALTETSRATAVWPFLEEIRTAAKRASELTNQMLAYSGKGRFVVETLNLNEVVQEMGRLLEVTIPKKVVLRYDLTESLPCVEVDATQIRQVVMNLVTNGADAMTDQSGVITIATGLVEADRGYLAGSFLDEQLPDGYYVSLEVSDTGCGMDAETQSRLFDPFFTTKTAGRGLGMAAVLGIVRGHHGTVRVYSEEGRGSTFKILLPASKDIDSPEAEEAPATAAMGPRTILVVDDEESVRMLAKRMLNKLGHEVALACDGVEALDEFERGPEGIDLVVLDMTMPRMDGQETFRRLRAVNPEVRVVLSSGYNEQDATNRFAGKGLAGFIQKPYTLEELAAVVQQAMETADPEAD